MLKTPFCLLNLQSQISYLYATRPSPLLQSTLSASLPCCCRLSFLLMDAQWSFTKGVDFSREAPRRIHSSIPICIRLLQKTSHHSIYSFHSRPFQKPITSSSPSSLSFAFIFGTMPPARTPAGTRRPAHASALARTPACKGCGRSFPTRWRLNTHYARSLSCVTALRATLPSFRRRHSPSVGSCDGRAPALDSPHEPERESISAEGITAQLGTDPLPANAPGQRSRVWVKEVPDEGDPSPEGPVIDIDSSAGAAYSGEFLTAWEQRRQAESIDSHDPWAPFKDVEEWDLVKWMMTSGLSQASMDNFLSLPIVRVTANLHCRFLAHIYIMAGP